MERGDADRRDSFSKNCEFTQRLAVEYINYYIRVRNILLKK